MQKPVLILRIQSNTCENFQSIDKHEHIYVIGHSQPHSAYIYKHVKALLTSSPEHIQIGLSVGLSRVC